MPYIKSKQMRSILDKQIDELKDCVTLGGSLYYYLMELFKRRIQNVGMSYAEARQWLGEIEATILELCRRYGVPSIYLLRDLNYEFLDMREISQKQKDKINAVLKKAVQPVPDGTLNYLLHALFKRGIGKEKEDRWKNYTLLEFISELKEFEFDLNRDYMGIYEDKKIKENGDV
jgi:hypothetical protein